MCCTSSIFLFVGNLIIPKGEHFGSFFYYFLFTPLYGHNQLNYSNVYLVELLASIFSLILVSIAGKIYKNKYNVGIKSIGTVKLLLFSILAGVDAFVVTGLATILINDYEGNHKGIFFVLFFITIIAVSYTHLDVYKRQLQNSA